jgi:hypothetical protein
MTATAYERVLDALRGQGKKVRQGSNSAAAQCPSHDDKHNSLGVYSKPGKAKVVCFAGCDDQLDILPALGLKLLDLWDQPKTVQCVTQFQPDPAVQARIQARRTMTAPQRELDDLIHLPDIGTRLVLAIAQIRPELYFALKHGLDISSNEPLLADPGYRHVAHLLGGEDR